MRLDQPIEVRSRFDGSWARGFTVAELQTSNQHTFVRVRRLSDGAVLPASFDEEDIRVVER